MKKALLVLVLLSSLLVLWKEKPTFLGKKTSAGVSLYSLAFTCTGANLLESRIDCWAKLKTNSSTDEMRILLARVAAKLGDNTGPVRFHTNINNGVTIVRGNFTKGNERFFLTAQSNGGQTYLLVSIIARGAASFDSYQEEVNAVVPVKTARLYTGSLEGYRSQEEKTALLRSMFKQLKARRVEDYRDDSVVSMTGLSPLISEQLSLGGKQYNLQAAVNYNEVEDKTYIYLGIPLILGEY